MVLRIFSVFVLFVLVFSLSSAQIYRDTTFVAVSSADVGCQENGCLVACVSSSVLSLNDSRVSNRELVIGGVLKNLERTGGNFPYNPSDVIRSVINFLRAVF